MFMCFGTNIWKFKHELSDMCCNLFKICLYVRPKWTFLLSISVFRWNKTMLLFSKCSLFSSPALRGEKNTTQNWAERYNNGSMSITNYIKCKICYWCVKDIQCLENPIDLLVGGNMDRHTHTSMICFYLV
jgi:hypothetical protein